MKAALEASYHAGEATEPDWVREERALHKVDDQMARDVKSEATKSSRYAATGTRRTANIAPGSSEPTRGG